jgi:deoxyribonuclease-1/deoxyribonuclease-1-like protein
MAETGLVGRGEFSVLSFNIQVFGRSKMRYPAIAKVLAGILSRYDLVAVQEVRSKNTAPVNRLVAMLPANRAYVLSPRVGKSLSKEQFLFIYDKSKIAIKEHAVYPDHARAFERPPFAVYCKSAGGFDFIVINNHVKPAATRQEIAALPACANYFAHLWKDNDVMIVGDLNADGNYYDEKRLASVFPTKHWRSLIDNTMDTTVARSSNTYDRFIISSHTARAFTGKAGVFRFDKTFNFKLLGIKPKDISDHFPIWAVFYSKAR